MRGIWFYGLAGSGKSFASELVHGVKKNSFVIDGDDVRALISTDLGYSVSDRKTQTARLLGIAELCLLNGCFPIVSSVTMNIELINRCNILNIDVVKILRPFDQISSVREIYEKGKDVVGVDIELEDFDLPQIQNDGTRAFERAVLKYV